MSWIKRLFGGAPAEPTFEDYNGYRIFVTPQPTGGKYRLGARIELDVDGETLVHDLIRADVLDNIEQANNVSLLKAKQVIDQQGKDMFR
ncbi:MAG: HlyU family transcriptional regulator [Yoonia sp.]